MKLTNFFLTTTLLVIASSPLLASGQEVKEVRNGRRDSPIGTVCCNYNNQGWPVSLWRWSATS